MAQVNGFEPLLQGFGDLPTTIILHLYIKWGDWRELNPHDKCHKLGFYH